MRSNEQRILQNTNVIACPLSPLTSLKEHILEQIFAGRVRAVKEGRPEYQKYTEKTNAHLKKMSAVFGQWMRWGQCGAFMMMAVVLLHELIIQLHFTLTTTDPTSH